MLYLEDLMECRMKNHMDMEQINYLRQSNYNTQYVDCHSTILKELN